MLTQPMMGTLRGKQACRESFQRLFALIPDLHADVHRVGHGTHEVFIEFTLSGTYGGKPIAWDAVDRFTFAKGLIAERVSYFDSAPLMVKLVGRPGGWERLSAPVRNCSSAEAPAYSTCSDDRADRTRAGSDPPCSSQSSSAIRTDAMAIAPISRGRGSSADRSPRRGATRPRWRPRSAGRSAASTR